MAIRNKPKHLDPPQKGGASDEIAVMRIHVANQDRLFDLDLSDLDLKTFPESIGNLTYLKTLTSQGNPLISLPDSFTLLHNLRTCTITGTRLRSLPTVLRHLPALELLNVSAGQLQELPSWIGEMRSLRILVVSFNHLNSLSESIGELKHLEQLYATNNRLKSLPFSLRALPRLKILLLHENEQLKLPSEVLGNTLADVIAHRGVAAEPQAILNYYFRTRDDVKPLNEAKLILIGRGEVGKTCVVNRLVRDNYVDTSKTQGIRIEQWSLQLAKDKVKLHVWDFGGQEIMHATHQFFMTQRSLYLLVLAGRQGGEDADAEYWLQLIESFGGDSPVIVVLNKITEHPFNLDYRGLRAKYPSIRGFARIDCKDGSNLNDLRDLIRRETDALKDLRVPFPKSWIAIKNQVAGMAERGENYISFEAYGKLCWTYGEQDTNSQELLAGYLHALGVALNYRDDPRLNDTHVLSPHWVTNGIYSLLNWPELEARGGELKFEDLATLLDANHYPQGKHRFLLDLMRKFESCFEYPDDAQRRYLVPQLLGKEQPAGLGEFDARECLNFQYHYNIVPEGLLPRFIVRTHQLSKTAARWRTGVVLEFESNRALVRADLQGRKVFISVNGPRDARRRLLAVIRSDFERIHADLKKLQVKEMVPVPGRPEAVVPYKTLRVRERSQTARFSEVFGEEEVELDVQELLNGVDIEGARRTDVEAGSHMDTMPVFISYSHKDETLRSELETHLKLLQRDGSIAMWTDRKIGAGVEWKGEIDRNLEAAEIILLLISSDFLASEYCYDVEMKRALERHSGQDATVIPVILRDVDWQTADFAKLQALPKDGKAVTLWPNADSAWKDVALGIRAAVKARRDIRHH